MAPTHPHPLDPLQPGEIAQAAAVIRPRYSEHQINFRVITLKEPSKCQMIKYLDAEHESTAVPPQPPCRLARCQIIVTRQGRTEFRELIVNLNECAITSDTHLVGKHSYIDSDYMQAVEKACRADPRVQKQIDTLKLPDNAHVIVEAWAYATDGENDMTERTTMVRAFLFALSTTITNIGSVLVLHALWGQPRRKLLRIPPRHMR